MNPDVIKLNEERKQAVESGKDPYAGNLASLSSFSTVNSQNLTPSAPIKLPQIPADTSAAGVSGASQGIIQNIDAQSAQQAKMDEYNANLEMKKSSAMQAFEAAQGNVNKRLEERASAEGDVNTVGTPAFNKEIARQAGNKLKELSVAKLGELKALEGSGLTDIQRQQKSNEISRRYGFQELEQQLKYNLANDDYQSAEENLNKRLELDLIPLQNDLNYRKEAYDEVRGLLNKTQEKQFDSLIKQDEDRINQITANRTAVNNTLLKALQDGVVMNPNVFARASKANDVGELTQILGASGISLANPLDMEYKRAQIANIYSEIGKRNAETSSTANTVVQLPNGSKITNETYDSRNSTINLINTVLNDPQLHNVVGGGKALQSINPLAYLPGAPHKAVKAQVDQIQGLLALENRTKLKGSGQISDYESKTLERAASAFNTNLSYAAATDALKQVRGVLTTMNGGQAYVEVTDPNTGEKATAQADTAAINKMISDGLVVKYQ